MTLTRPLDKFTISDTRRMDRLALTDFLNRKVNEYNRPDFIATDPICLPHLFTKKQDIEIAGFFAAIFAWGNRTTIISKCRELMQRMDMSPFEFIKHHNANDLRKLEGFCHRTFNDTDLLYFVSFLHHHYKTSESLESAFWTYQIEERSQSNIIEQSLNQFYAYFFSLEHVPARTKKHIASPIKNSACKRINMFLRWMVRNDGKGVDFGIWKGVPPSQLICPVDVHVARVAKRFGMIDRKQADWQAALSLTRYLRQLDSKDPVKYDFALFALGVLERF